MNPVEFLRELWGPQPAGLIQVWELERKRSSYYRAPAGTAILTGRRDVYTAVALTHKDHGTSKRGRADQAIAIPGLWLDIDVDGGPQRKTGGVPDQAAAVELAYAITEPTLLVDSGYGIHAWYLFDDGPWLFQARADQQHATVLSAQWYLLHRQQARARGWGLDVGTRDLARLLRLPGTINGKGGADRPVAVIDRGVRRARGRLESQCANAGPVELVDLQSVVGDEPDLVVDGRVDPDRLAALIANSDEFATTWRHQRGPGWSMSEYDLSIVSQAAQAGFTDQELADLIVHHRRLWNPSDPKASRLDYLRRTVAKARLSTIERHGRERRLADLAGRRAA